MLANVDRLVVGGRSREGAWIEIARWCCSSKTALCRSREGAWIEIIGGDLAAGAGAESLPRGSVD